MTLLMGASATRYFEGLRFVEGDGRDWNINTINWEWARWQELNAARDPQSPSHPLAIRMALPPVEIILQPRLA